MPTKINEKNTDSFCTVGDSRVEQWQRHRAFAPIDAELPPINKGKSASINRIGLPKGSHNGAIRGVYIHGAILERVSTIPLMSNTDCLLPHQHCPPCVSDCGLYTVLQPPPRSLGSVVLASQRTRFPNSATYICNVRDAVVQDQLRDKILAGPYNQQFCR